MASPNRSAGEFPSMNASAQGRQSPKLTFEGQSKLGERLSTNSAAHKEATLRKLREDMILSESKGKIQKKLNADEQEDSIDRLYKQSEVRHTTMLKRIEQKYLVDPIANRKRLTLEELDNSVDKLYTQSMSKKTSVQEKLERKYLAPPEHSRLDSEALSESVHRLYGSHARREALLSTLRKKYRFQHPDAGKPRLDTDTLKASADRLAQVPRDNANWPVSVSAATRTKLEDKYVKDSLPSFPVRSGPK
eukprot:CAMPEP_0174328902 /NCGR_PEP_ID=MMETSP0810-20121108/15459_1 /TAXON_ID=73025 ORGANISM="Eutreptiella gymnastica-like, Strain CCMP1594" /NCGR_SAMPLE_ID=MMETSP0810 /ASSEMBLY_ACC=CAM_ASM_000659 /LENGTH=247 /DNA_ID=CAMNT_0015443169 /DNA_START=104 /DNA_END=847 /DNA_ORIENTATION=-